MHAAVGADRLLGPAIDDVRPRPSTRTMMHSVAPPVRSAPTHTYTRTLPPRLGDEAPEERPHVLGQLLLIERMCVCM